MTQTIELRLDLMMVGLLVIGLVVFLWLLLKAQNAPDRFDLRDLVMDTRKVSLTKTSQTGGLPGEYVGLRVSGAEQPLYGVVLHRVHGGVDWQPGYPGLDR